MSLIVEHDYTIDIADALTDATPLGFSFIQGDAKTHKFNITLTNGGSAVSLSGASAGIYVKRPLGDPVFNEATTTDDIISASLAAESFAYTGRIYVYVEIAFTDQTITPFYRYAQVLEGVGDTFVDPGESLLTLPQMIALIAAFQVFEAYDEGTSYEQYNRVTFGTPTSTYMWNSATPSVAGVDPTESADWLLVAEHGAIGATGTRGTRTNVGTAITGTETTPTVYATGLSDSIIGDQYAYNGSNEADIGNIYVCTLGGNAATALWAYDHNQRGGTGATGAAGADFTIIGTYADLTALRAAVPSPPVGVFYNVGASAPYTVYRSTGEANPNDWESQGTLEGAGVAIGGTTGQFLKKKSSTDYDTEWGAVPAESTSNAGLSPQATAPSAGLRNILGIDNGETAHSDKALFDATDPSTQAFGDAAAVGTAMAAARRDHKHAIPSLVDNLTSTSTTSGLTANQGKALQDNKQAKATITENTDAAPALETIANNTEYRCTHGTPTAAPTMTIASISANTTEFACNVIYKAKSSSPSAPAVTNNSGKTIKYQGDDVVSGTFTPVASKIYRLGWVWDGIYLNCYIKGVS